MPDSISTLERQAFRGCEKLKKTNIPPSVDNIIGFAYTCNHLAQVAVDAKNPYYRSVDGVVFDQRNDQLVFYPAGRTDQKYVIPPGTKSVGANAFANAQIEEVEIPDTITEIGPNAFFYNPNLRTVILPEGLEIINSGAFSCCKSLETISLPSSLVWMGYNPFEQCDSLEAIQMDQDHPALMMVDNVLVRKEDMCLIWYPAADRRNRYEIPAGIKTIGVEAFSYCDINEIVIPEGVEKISAHAFTSVQNLERVVLPASLSDIEPLAFNSSDDITFVVIPGSFSEEYCAANDRRIEYP